MKDYVEVKENKCSEVHNCMCVKEVNGKTYCRGCGNVQPGGKVMNKGKIIFTFYFKNGRVIKKSMDTQIFEEKVVEKVKNILQIQKDMEKFFASDENFYVTVEGFTVKGSELIAVNIEREGEES